MKKYLVVALAALFVLGFAASSFAIHAEIPAETQAVVAKSATQITIGGEVRVRGDYRANTTDFNNDVNSSGDQAYYDERVRLSVEAKVTPNTTGYIQLESSAGFSGTNADNFIFGAFQNDAASGARGSVQLSNRKQGEINFLQAWILHQGTGLLGVPALVKAGHMPITVGSGMFYDHSYQGDDAILLGVDPIKGLHLILGTIKLAENSLNVNNDATAYALLVNYDINKDSGIGLDITYLDGQNGSVLPGDVHFWNIGLNGKFAIAGFGLYAEANMQTGKESEIAALVPDQKFRGWAGKAGATYTLAPVKLGLEFAAASGDDNPTDNKISTFITSQGATQHYTYVFDYRTINGAGNTQGGLQNTWYLKASGAADITKDLSAGLDVYYLRAMKKVNTTPGLDKKDIGVEVDAKVNYKIDRNLNYFVEGGYLFAGDFFRNVKTLNAGEVRASANVDDAWVVRHGIQLSF